MTTATHPTQPAELHRRIAADLALQQDQVTRTVSLLLDDATVPFIARYRKEVTGNLDEEAIRRIGERHQYYQDLERRRTTILATIAEQGQLTDKLRQQITTCFDKAELEDLYLPYRPKRQTKASVAIERGLEPLASVLWRQEPGEQSIEEMAASLVNPEKGVASIEEAVTGASHIVAEWIAEQAELRKTLRALILGDGQVRATVVRGKENETTKFRDYYDFREPVVSIPSHRILAVLRGVREGILTSTIEIDTARALKQIEQVIIRQPDTVFTPYLQACCADAYCRLLLPSLQSEVRRVLKERADTEAITVFQGNLRNLLMFPPLGSYGVLGLDPGLRTGCKMAVVDQTGKFLEHTTIYPLPPKRDITGAKQTLQALLTRHQIRAIAVGNGTGSREAEEFVRQCIDIHHSQDLLCVVVNEAGASVYSASKEARAEFPALDVTVRGAISIARRLQDPLAELVKIDPKSIGVGQYQHDVDQKRLRLSLADTVESCVNHVGVDVNTASSALLQYVSGLGLRQAQNIVAHRETHGEFTDRQQFLQVSGLGEKTFQQAAGFLRIKNGNNLLDNTAVHPESYRIVELMAASLSIPVAELIANAELIGSIDLNQFVNEQAGLFTLEDIRDELLKPGRDPREQFVMPRFRADVTTVADLREGMILEGVVSNVTNFGAFVDIGVHQDGLVHISELSQRFIRDPHEVVHVGKIVRVKILGVDEALQRISLSMKALQTPPKHASNAPSRLPKAPRTPRRNRRKTPPRKVTEQETASMEDKLRALKAHFHGSGSS